MKLLRISTALTLMGLLVVLGCQDDRGFSPTGGGEFEPAETPRPAVVEGFAIGPIDGMTTGWHALPEEPVAIPVGATLQLKYSLPADATIAWSGATEVSRDKNASYAVCPTERLGRISVQASVVWAEGTAPLTQVRNLNVIGVRVSDIEIQPIGLRQVDPPLEEYLSNDQTLTDYFGGSIAKIREVGDEHYRTSTHNEVALTTDTSHPKLAWLTEWRINGVPQVLGTAMQRSFGRPGSHAISVGPPSRASELQVDTYEVTVTSHTSHVDLVPEGQPVTFTAVTNPAGYEREISWLAATKFGSTTPVVGTGAEFTVTFHDTWGSTQWLGVRADNGLFAQDQKPCTIDPWGTLSEGIEITQISFDPGSAIPPIPADFFFPGSDPFLGNVQLVGTMSQGQGLPDEGMTDTKVERSGPLRFPGAGFPRPSDPVQVEIVELNLVGAQPINVGPINEPWMMSMGLADNQVPGILQAVLDSPDGGTFNATLPMKPLLVFVRVSEIDALAQGLINPNDLDLRILDWDVEGLPPVDMGFSAPQPFSTVPPQDGGFFYECETAQQFPFFPGVLPGGGSAAHESEKAPGLAPHIAAGGPGHLHYVCPPPPPPPGQCSLSSIGRFSLFCGGACANITAVKFAIPCGPPAGPAPCPPGPFDPACPPFAIGIQNCVNGGFCLHFFAFPQCCQC